jgi:mannosyl-glycoprotein endo-beta-N-acetylglucosaminidase
MNSFETVTRQSSMNTALRQPVNRRRLLKMLGVGTAALVVGGAGLVERADARSTDSLIVNTEGARLRSGPGTSYSVLTSLAKGTEVRFLADGGTANGYRWYKVRVLATGKEGFMASNLLSAPGSSPGSDPVIVGTATTTATVNLRSGPSTGHQVLRVVASGATVQVSSTIQSGFRYVVHNGLAGWIADQYLSSRPGDDQSGNYRTTTTALNLRAEPSTSAKILAVMPAGARVQLLHTGVGSFGNVNYNGMQGWAHLDYLK